MSCVVAMCTGVDYDRTRDHVPAAAASANARAPWTSVDPSLSSSFFTSSAAAVVAVSGAADAVVALGLVGSVVGEDVVVGKGVVGSAAGVVGSVAGGVVGSAAGVVVSAAARR